MAVKAGENAGTPGTLNIDAAFEGITYAADNGARIINMSFGYYGYFNTDANVIAYAVSKGVVLVASAGNDNTSTLRYPASYTGVISVAASDENDKKASFSNYGSKIDVCAPGTNIWSLAPNEKIARFNGTSQSSPIVSGLAGLILAYNPNLTPAQVESCIKSSAVDVNNLNPAYSGKLGVGRINAGAALQCAATLTSSRNTPGNSGDLIIYPNPFMTSFTLKIPSDVFINEAELKIYDVRGELVKIFSIKDYETTINKDGLQNGLYFYSFYNNNEIIVNGKLMVQ
jgi:subtilisin family serine protease